MSTTGVRFACAVGNSLRLCLCPDQCQSRQHSYAVHEVAVVLGQLTGVSILLTDMRVVRLRIRSLRWQRRVGTSQEHNQVTEFRPGCWAHAVTAPVFDSQVPGLEGDEQGLVFRQGLELGGFADAALAEQNQLHPFFLAQALISGNDWKSHHATSRSS